MKRAKLIDLVSLLFVILFLCSGINELIRYQTFKSQIAASPFLFSVASIISMVVLILQLIICLVSLLSWRLTVLYMSLGYLIVFTLYALIMFLSKKDLDWNCIQIGIKLSNGMTLIFNGILIALAALAIKLERKYRHDYYQEIFSRIKSITIATPKDFLGY
jgi:hypothetical protein